MILSLGQWTDSSEKIRKKIIYYEGTLKVNCYCILLEFQIYLLYLDAVPVHQNSL